MDRLGFLSIHGCKVTLFSTNFQVKSTLFSTNFQVLSTLFFHELSLFLLSICKFFVLKMFARFYSLESLGYLKNQRKWDSFLHFRWFFKWNYYLNRSSIYRRKAEICKLFVLNLTFFMRFSTKRWHKRDWWIITMMSCKSEDIRCRCQSSNPDYGLCREWRVAAQISCRTCSERLWYSSFPTSPQQDKYYGHW